jgi:hypothetical protein
MKYIIETRQPNDVEEHSYIDQTDEFENNRNATQFPMNDCVNHPEEKIEDINNRETIEFSTNNSCENT